MARLIICALAVSLLAAPVLAGSSETEKVEAFLASKGDGGRHGYVYLAGECLDIINDELKAYMYALREQGKMPPYSSAWCLAKGFVPWHLRKNATRS